MLIRARGALIAAGLLCALPLFSQGLPARETLSYNVEWRLITAGKAQLDWSTQGLQHGARGYQVRLHLESTGLVSKLFRVDDTYSSQLTSDLCVLNSQIRAEEGRRNRDTKVTYDPASRKASYIERDVTKNSVVAQHEIDIPGCVHDVVGGLYVLRSMNLEPGQSTQIPVSDGKKSVMARVEAQQREEIRTPAGTFKTIRYEVFLFNDVLYKRSAHLYVWISDDARKLPAQIRVRMQFTIGTITLQLAKEEKS
jgi:hypothetical protein